MNILMEALGHKHQCRSGLYGAEWRTPPAEVDKVNNISKFTARESMALYLRAFPGRNRLRTEVAGALEVPIEQVRGLTEDADPAVRMGVVAFVRGFQVAVELFIDPRRASVQPLELLALNLTQRLGEDAAHHDGSANPYGYNLVRPTGERFAVGEIADESDGLCLDEGAGSMRRLSPLSE